jgi:hypothetical protein
MRMKDRKKRKRRKRRRKKKRKKRRGMVKTVRMRVVRRKE